MTKNIITTKVVRGYTVNIFTDPDPSKPDENTDQPVYMVADNMAFAHRTKLVGIYRPTSALQSGWMEDHYGDSAWMIVGLQVRDLGYHVVLRRMTVEEEENSILSTFVAVNKEEFIKYAMLTGKEGKNAELVAKAVLSYDWDAIIDGVIAKWNMYLTREVLAFEIIDVNGRQIESVYGFYDIANAVMAEAENNVPNYETPAKEDGYVWRVAYAAAPTTMYNPYASQEEFLYPDEASALLSQPVVDKDAKLYLCKQTTTPVSFHKAKQ